MAEHRYSVDTALPVGTLWDFVREMDHWAPFLTGYPTHEKRSETESVEGVNEPAGRLARLWRPLVRAPFRRLRAPVRLRAEGPAGGVAPPAVARKTFHLRIEPGGPMAPMIDAMMKPAMEAAAEDLARRIVHHLESRDGEAP